ncbi:CRISPR-associated endoribonuclease Cas6 [Shimazuella kribbensis]|uniref:CRISPR-associated endoribonuclease Cas6 n=1 Tax=Shimazuella kribbensis TaxID=139808 RepID=UPI0004101FE3|nr:CRISPR-associated endoribonuclease Cas6 [Shimazuella kribbensis]
MITLRIQAKFHTEQEISLPYNLNYLISSYLYQCLSRSKADLSKWLHEEGIVHNKRRYKPLAFSNLQFVKKKFQPNYQLVNGEATLLISSMKEEICIGLIEGIWKMKGLQLMDCHLPLVEVKILPTIEFHSVMRYKSLSPIVVASQQEGRIHFCHPLESRFYDQLRNTMRNWYEIKWEEKLDESSVDISIKDPTKFDFRKSSVLTEVKKRKIKGYMLDVEVKAPPKAQQIIYEQSLGNYAVQGFGFLSPQIDTEVK